jgi:ribosomal protein L7Ae-like RNA K-turn-binding protein
MLSMAQRAGKVASGEFMTESSVKEGKSFLVIVAGDASDNTKKKFQDMCTFRNVPLLFYGDRDSLGHAIGKEFRSSLSVNDEGLAAEIRKKATEVV